MVGVARDVGVQWLELSGTAGSQLGMQETVGSVAAASGDVLSVLDVLGIYQSVYIHKHSLQKCAMKANKSFSTVNRQTFTGILFDIVPLKQKKFF